jgi:nucleoside-diphosphate-sugar epimerase
MQALVTGGAGFIGSNLVRSLVASGDRVKVLDDLSTGSEENLRDCDGLVDLVVGDVRDPEVLSRVIKGAEVVYQLAALPSVSRSVARPRDVNRVNVEGTLNVLIAARDAGVRRVVYASSSSVYGDTPTLPKHEDMAVMPLSPYAASKLAGEAYCRSFSSVYRLETVSLRFFNVFGPWQDPESEYAAVIPRFVTRMLKGQCPKVFGDGRQSRDFTFVANAIQACVLAAAAGPEAVGEAMNVACGDRITVIQLVDAINDALGTSLPPTLGPPRPGDVRHSLASITRAERLIGYRPLVTVRDGLAQTVSWFGERIPRAPVAGPVGK